jgi:hypothetical protein
VAMPPSGEVRMALQTTPKLQTENDMTLDKKNDMTLDKKVARRKVSLLKLASDLST